MAERSVATDDDLIARVAWSRIAEPGDPAAGVLIAGLGPVVALDWLRSGSSQPPGLSPHRGWRLATDRWRPRLRDLDPGRELGTIDRLGGTVLVPTDPRWPPGLHDLGNAAPICLWIRGDAELARLAHPAVAVVGARANTGYGAQVAADLSAGLVAAGVTVVSGGAFGIDACAHHAVLGAGGRPLAVMAGGLDRFYPVANTELLHSVVRTGAVVSEVPPGTAPMRQRFLARNRLIAALAQVTVVVEAAWRSGALSTARHALELLRPLGVVPGPVTSMASAGCHRMLREGSAVCVTDAGEVLELLGELDGMLVEPDTAPGFLDGLEPEQARLLDALPLRGTADPDNLVRVSGLSIGQTLAGLGELELAGRIKRAGAGWRRV
ncbi:MAG: DNA-processing protein DprA [Beutenbergiaceae bacterium]